ncbi:SHOCT domain-containing protein [Halomarina salina]|uniref:SHOCT domain-containing protein n=1 Tax=Halomarina salina TaxID=1872699 RepID=A0ABD5RM47_9EURY|nr:SHOCT domain-containing protein [Halomarina salina]
MTGESWREKVIAILPMLILGLGFLDLFMDVLPGVPFYLVFVVGFAVVLPIAAILLSVEDDDGDGDGEFVSGFEREMERFGHRMERFGERMERTFEGTPRRDGREGRDRRENDTHRQTGADDVPDAETNNRDAIETLRQRYANGDLTDAQFEAKLDRLLETDTPENAQEWRERERHRERAGDR